ncbi:hypothetical protein LIER_39564 [Lithospermum erythrorhizon]|uniref:Uncharacterized protein n=1 Tax=Lithospermum erythrorhizon TaxID=34254 RepID=A0AAV3QGP9_LITER
MLMTNGCLNMSHRMTIMMKRLNDEEDRAVVITKRKKAMSKLKLNENRVKVGNKRVPKNVAAVSIANMSFNSEEEQVKWRFVVNRRVAAEKMLSEVTKNNANKEDILTIEDIEGLASRFIPISPKLMQGTHVADIPLVTVDTVGGSKSGTDETARVLRDEIRHLDGVIQFSMTMKSVLEARLRSLSGENEPEVDPAVGGIGAAAPHT